MTQTITIIGLGNYGIEDLPLGIYRFIQKQPKIYARTLEHPVIEDLKNEIEFEGFDDIYENNDQFEKVYDEIVKQLIDKAKFRTFKKFECEYLGKRLKKKTAALIED